MILAILNALAAIPSILKYVEEFASAVTLWYCQRQESATLSQIADAAARSAHAQNEEERYAALDAWKKALSRSRITPR